MNEGFSEIEAAEPKPYRRGLVIGGAAAVLLGCCVLLVVAGLVLVADPFDLNVIARLTGRYDAAAAVMPVDTGFYAGVNLLNLKPEEISRISQPFIEALDDPEMEDLGGAQEAFSEQFESELGIDVETDVVPWIGQYIGLGLTELAFDNFGEVESADWVVAVEARDRDAADAFLLKLRDGLTESSGSSVAEQSYEGVTLYVMQGGSPSEQIAFGRSGGVVIAGATVAAVQAAIDAQNGDSLDESEGYEQIIGNLPRGRALTVFSTGDGIRELISSVEGVAAVPINPSGLPLTSFTSSATSFSIVEEGLQIDFVSYFDEAELTTTQQALLEAGGRPSETAELFPNQTVAFASGQRLDLLWLSIREATGDEVGFDESMDAFGQEFGLNPNSDLFPLLNGEWALAVIAGPAGLLAEELEVPLGFSFVAATDRPGEMADTVEAIRAGLEGQLLSVEEAETNGISSYQLRFVETGPPALAFGVEQDYFFIASSEAVAVDTFSGQSALASSEQYQRVEAAFANDVNLSFYLDVRTLLGTLRESRAGFDLLDFDEGVRLFEPVEAVALGNSYENGLRRTQVIVFIETE